MQPAHRPRRGDLERKLAALFPDDDDRALARDLLESYGTEPHHREHERVRLAVLKVAGGDLDRLATWVEAANWDFRDPIAQAEYPAYCRLPPGVDPESAEARAAIAADAAQYREWLEG